MKIGFIGTGNMGGAILKGCCAAMRENGDTICACNRSPEKVQAIAAAYPVEVLPDAAAVAEQSGIVVLGVKPDQYPAVLPQIAAVWQPDKVLVSMAAGVTIAAIEAVLGSGAKIVRIMPNTPAQVGMAMTSLSRSDAVDEEAFAPVLRIFNAVGRAEEVPEELIHCVIGISGSSPAYTYMYIEALMKAAVAEGMEEEKARVFAAQAVKGAAQMVLDSEKTPEQLRIDVCSPGGTTIEAVNALQKNGFEEDVAEGFRAAADKSRKMSEAKD
ncbi:MAG: pyrroline-5-carboxylate reductase [Anaerovoracaceae bacterium]|jgi:pyrroline-5-carboxylate reductase